ncbi:hypothetical protein DFO77_109101 [Marinilabilia salmonicolor]|uniref:Uncharacterized protein n=1 Tax=Marinilabilia salmonicolor TaxID=989 RepID=A0A2T0XTI6_9BACT|nr:hypothetical protein BY457_101203 [Marinilabilia salmonicolor]RCW36137.1 hypothetical protein DFO77_109101 [Marinilabilia salmonicolor]
MYFDNFNLTFTNEYISVISTLYRGLTKFRKE